MAFVSVVFKQSTKDKSVFSFLREVKNSTLLESRFATTTEISAFIESWFFASLAVAATNTYIPFSESEAITLSETDPTRSTWASFGSEFSGTTNIISVLL